MVKALPGSSSVAPYPRRRCLSYRCLPRLLGPGEAETPKHQSERVDSALYGDPVYQKFWASHQGCAIQAYDACSRAGLIQCCCAPDLAVCTLVSGCRSHRGGRGCHSCSLQHGLGQGRLDAGVQPCRCWPLGCRWCACPLHSSTLLSCLSPLDHHDVVVCCRLSAAGACAADALASLYPSHLSCRAVEALRRNAREGVDCPPALAWPEECVADRSLPGHINNQKPALAASELSVLHWQ